MGMVIIYMIKEIEKYFIPNNNASCFLPNGKRILVSVDRKNNERTKTAVIQAKEKTVPIEEVFSYVNEFLDVIKGNVANQKNQVNRIELDGIEHEVINNGIIVKNCSWKEPKWDGKRYTFCDSKYDFIKKVFDLNYANDIIWLKFSSDGYLGVVADSFDINFKYDNSSGKLLKQLTPEKKWDENFVYIFPLTKELLKIKNRKEIETAVGNYLIDKGVPIIDYYSHNNFL